jgi:adenosylcobinamide-GDP ribazoletransferase
MIDGVPGVTEVGGRFDPAGELLAALRLLTRLRLGSPDAATGPAAGANNEATGAAAFPVVGALVGAIGMVPLVVLGAGDPLLAGFLALAGIAVVTGALHLDGLADTADALLAPDVIRADRARKDPSVGVGGVVALVLVIGIEVAALADLTTVAGGWVAGGALVVAAITGRTMAVVAVVMERPRIARDGFGAWWAARVRPRTALVAGLIAVLIAAAVAIAASAAAVAIGGLAGAAVGIVLARVIVAWRDQLDGDGLGAIVELTVAAVLVATALVAGTTVP